MASEHVQARWNGPYPGQLPTGAVLQAGDLVTVHRSQLASTHFEEVKPAKASKTDADKTEGAEG